MKNVVIIIRTDEHFDQFLVRKAKDNRMTKSELIRKALKQVLKYKEPVKELA